MRGTLSTEPKSGQVRSISRIIFSVDRGTGKIISAVPVVDSDEELAALEPWIQAALILSELIRPAKIDTRAAA